MSFPFDGSLPRDAVQINPHYFGDDPQALVNALSTNFAATTFGALKPHTFKAYDALKPPPSYPLATKTVTGTPPNSGIPREVAICLSYYTTYNRPRYRGRLYLIPTWFTSVANVRPSGAIQQAALDFAHEVLTKSLPANTDMVVFSKVEGKAMGGVSDFWVDDEWDTVRSRGLRGTTRLPATRETIIPAAA
jgi:hypothetical protein